MDRWSTTSIKCINISFSCFEWSLIFSEVIEALLHEKFKHFVTGNSSTEFNLDKLKPLIENHHSCNLQKLDWNRVFLFKLNQFNWCWCRTVDTWIWVRNRIFVNGIFNSDKNAKINWILQQQERIYISTSYA